MSKAGGSADTNPQESRDEDDTCDLDGFSDLLRFSGGPSATGNRLILAHYPSGQVFTDMIRSAEYQAVSRVRTEAIELGLIWPFSMVVN